MEEIVGMGFHPTNKELSGHYLRKKEKIVGMGFHPTNEELIGHYLRNKRLDPDYSVQKIREINFYNYEPQDLPGLALVQLNTLVWYFFVALDYKYTNSKRANRRTRGGTWKGTGKERDIKDKLTKKVIGSKRTLVFYKGRKTSKEHRTNWVMHEYHCKPDPLFKGEFVLVRIKIKPDSKYDASTPSESVSSHHLTSDFGDHNAVVSQVESQGLPDNHMSCSSEDHTANFLFSKEIQPLPNQDISFHRESQLQPNHHISFNKESQSIPNYNFSSILPHHDISFDRESQLPPNYNLSLHDISLNRESQLPPNHNLSSILSQRDISLNRESQLLPNYNSFSNIEELVRTNTAQVEPLVLAGWGPLIDCNEVDQNSFSTQQRQQIDLQQQGFSHSSSFGNGSNVLNSPLGSQWEEAWRNSQWAVQDDFYGLETGHYHHPNVNSSKPVTGASSEVVEPLVAAERGAFIDCNELDQNSFSTQQSQQIDLQQQQQQGSSHSWSFVNDSNVLNSSPLGSEREEDWRSSQRAVQDDFFGLDTGHSHPPDFNSSKPVAGASVYDDGNDETIFAALLNELHSMGEYDFAALLNEFPSMEENDSNTIWQPPQSYTAIDDNILPVQMGSTVV
ncbi:hypothetical protein ACOSP7_024324 [Xanthoceras sorbifolium]